MNIIAKNYLSLKAKRDTVAPVLFYFNLESDMIRANCEFQSYYNKTDIKPTVLNGGFQIILANIGLITGKLCAHTIITFQ